MGREQGLVDLADGGDLLALEDSAAASQVGLQDRRRTRSQDGGELGDRGQPFAGGHGDGGAGGHPGHSVEVVRRDRLLEPQRVVGLQTAGEAQGAGWGELAVGSEQQVGPVPDRLADGTGVALGQVEAFQGGLATIEHGVRAGGVELDSGEAQVDGPYGGLGCHSRIRVEVRAVLGGVGVVVLRVEVGVGP